MLSVVPKNKLIKEGATEILSLAAAATAARAILAATAIVAYDLQFNHGSHLLSNRRLSMDLGKKIGVQLARALQAY